MLCPEVSNFPSPKVITSCKSFTNLEPVENHVNLNSFYKSIVITFPDEMKIPVVIEEEISEDSDYYLLRQCPLTELIEPSFIEHFVRTGKLYCLSVVKNCIVQNCAAITPDGCLTLHIINYIFQTIGLEGTKRPHGFYEIKIDLKTLKHYEKVKNCLSKLERFDFHISWLPDNEDVCPSSIAKYFYDRNFSITQESNRFTVHNPEVEEIPSIKDVGPQELSEWIGMLAIGGDTSPKETYISNYSAPESEHSLKSTRICLSICKGFLTPHLVINICKKVSGYVSSRDLDNYWASVSIQSNENSLWQWHPSSPKHFQAQNNSCSIFFTYNKNVMYSVGELKYS